MDATGLFADIRLLPVVSMADAVQALPLARTLLDAGLGAIEFTLRTDAGLAAIRQVTASMPELLIGAGSVLSADQLKEVQDAGAQFAVSPGHTDALLDAAEGFPYLPGASTASECMHLLGCGYRLQKFFPAELAGGLAAIRALAAPLPEVRFCATGGITQANAGAYLDCPAVTCVGGSWFVPGQALEQADFATIGKLSREAVATVSAR